jgi:rhodanese-related sulfurtransferase
MSVARFLALDGTGALLFNGFFLVAGYLLREQIDDFLALIAAFGGRLATVIGASIVAWIAFKFVQRQRFLRGLRVARIDVDALDALLASDAPPLVFDLRDRLSLEASGLRVPGARVIRMDELEARHAEIPRDQEIVLYCACPNDASSARMALLLKRRGIERVRPLHGGIDAWIASGRPVEPVEPKDSTEGMASMAATTAREAVESVRSEGGA